jgi:hypothetical protein
MELFSLAEINEYIKESVVEEMDWWLDWLTAVPTNCTKYCL